MKLHTECKKEYVNECNLVHPDIRIYFLEKVETLLVSMFIYMYLHHDSL
jgi:hypothetical protein